MGKLVHFVIQFLTTTEREPKPIPHEYGYFVSQDDFDLLVCLADRLKALRKLEEQKE